MIEMYQRFATRPAASLFAMLACKSYRFPAAARDTLALTGRTRCGRLDVVSTAPSPTSYIMPLHDSTDLHDAYLTILDGVPIC